MKRLILLLVLLAGGLAWAALAVPTTAASVNGTTISQQQLNSDVSAIAASDDYQCYLNSGESSRTAVGSAAGDRGGHRAERRDNLTATTAFVGHLPGHRDRRTDLLQLASEHQVDVTRPNSPRPQGLRVPHTEGDARGGQRRR